MELLALLLVGTVLGTVLGALGGGGGILAIPLLTTVLGMSVLEASTTSLVVVMLGALAGLIPHALHGRVDWRAGLTVGALGAGGAVLGARAALVADERLIAGGIVVLIFLAAAGMLRPRKPSQRRLTDAQPNHPVKSQSQPVSVAVGTSRPHGAQLPRPEAPATGEATEPSTAEHAGDDEPDPAPTGRVSWPRLFLIASGVGLITGFFGVGGGFVAVPALMIGARLPVPTATATGLLVIVMNSLVALGARGVDLVDWHQTAALGAVTIVAAIAAALWSRRVSALALRRGFGWMLLLMGGNELVQLVLASLPD